MNKNLTIILVVLILGAGFLLLKNNKDNQIEINTMPNDIQVIPISHASMILSWDGVAIYTDPSMYKVSNSNIFAEKPAPDIILFTDIHQDHFDIETLQMVSKEKTIIIAPKAVADELPEEMKNRTVIIGNSETINQIGFKIEAMPAYNIPESSAAFHPRGRGNGYVVEKDGARVYISGDTSGIPEMKNLKNIDMAFIAMNLPYTMSVEEAADAVLVFKPKKVYPYHYRTPDGFSDVGKFKELINKGDPNIEVVQLEWYPK